MNRISRWIGIGLLCALTWIGIAAAAGSKDESDLDRAATALNKDAGSADGEQAVMSRLESDYKVSADQISALRNQKLGYGEIAIVFSLAEKMPGGITDANIQQVLTLRQGPPVMGWGEIANKLGEKLGPVVKRVDHMAKDIEKGEKEEHGGMGKMEKPEHPSRMDRPDRPEPMGMGRH